MVHLDVCTTFVAIKPPLHACLTNIWQHYGSHWSTYICVYDAFFKCREIQKLCSIDFRLGVTPQEKITWYEIRWGERIGGLVVVVTWNGLPVHLTLHHVIFSCGVTSSWKSIEQNHGISLHLKNACAAVTTEMLPDVGQACVKRWLDCLGKWWCKRRGEPLTSLTYEQTLQVKDGTTNILW